MPDSTGSEQPTPTEFASGSQARTRTYSLRLVLVVLALAALAPTIGFAAYMVYRTAAVERDATMRRFVEAAASLTADVDREVAGYIAVAATLGNSGFLRTGNLDSFGRQAAVAAIPTNGWVLLTDREGRVLVSTLANPPLLPNPTQRLNPALSEQTFATLKPVVSGALLTRNPPVRAVISVDVPVIIDGQPAYSLALVAPASSLRAIIATQNWPDEWAARIFDSGGLTVTRNQDPESAGQPVRREILAATGRGLSGAFQAPSSDGRPFYQSYVRSNLTGWTTVLGVPVASVDESLRASLGVTLAGGALLLALGGLLALLVARRITFPVARLAAAAETVGHGGAVTVTSSGVRELDTLGANIVVASHNLRERAAQRERAERALESEVAVRRHAEEALRATNETLELRVQAEVAERIKAEEAFRQVQKMESIGQLTGGVAHDFNNLLQVMVGNLEALRRRVAGQGPVAPEDLRRLADNALRGAERAATLVRQLLAFSRRQPLQPKALDVNRLIAGLSDLLRQTLGESVAIETVLAAGLWAVSADQNQLESAVLNLAVNARDAMPKGGRITIESANVHIDESYALANDMQVGQYVMMAVSDTGEGMNQEVVSRAFDPFFTTKEVGKGTGLGLSQVYGFIKQSGGHVKIYSEVGQGTTVKLYLPRLTTGAPTEEKPAEPMRTRGNAEAILVVEDEDAVRGHTAEILSELGYHAVQAHDGPTALRLLDDNPNIRLMFTDVGLPGGMNGKQLADEARRRRPQIKILFTTGYARNAIIHHGRLDPGVDLIVKPFTFAALGEKIRQVLRGSETSSAD